MKQVVLVIEDNEEVRDNISEILTLSNYTVYSAPNGKEGLEMINKNPPDIILCDVMMPELDGYGVLRGLSNNPKARNIPFIFVTAKSEKQDFRKGMDLGADDYLVKPFTGNDLLSMISTRLKKSEALEKVLKNNLLIEESLLKTSISVEDIYKMTDKIITKKIRKKDMLFSEGDSAKYLHFVVSGKIKLFRTNDDGKEYITQIFKEKDFFGYSSLLEANIYEETAVAIEDSEIGSILKQDFYQLLLSNNELHAQFIKFVTSNLSEANDKLIKLAYNSARKRVAEAILYLANKYYEQLTDNLTFSVCRDDISSISGVSPESVSRNLTDLRTERLIELQTGKIKILNLKKLIGIKN
jgi:CheY-like chemotaxis protein